MLVDRRQQSMQAQWQTLRSLFPILNTARYVAACSMGPLSTPVEAAFSRFLDSWRQHGNPWESEWMPTAARTTEKFARLIGADTRSVGLNASVSAAVGAILSAINFTDERRRVVVSALDFPTVPDILLAYRDRGDIELEVLPGQNGDVPSELYDQAIDNGTALVCISTGSYATGALLPISDVVEMAHTRGALCLVDAFQTVGALTLDVNQLHADFVVTGALKYMLGCQGVGLIYAQQQTAERLKPRNIGWMAAANPFGTDFDHLEYAGGAARFQGGTFSIPSCYAAEAALDLLLEIGPSVIEERVLRLSRRFADGLIDLGLKPVGPMSPGKLGPMVAVPVVGDAHEWQERLRQEEAIITAARGASLRFAFHFYNDEDDVDACLDVVRRRLMVAPSAGGQRSPG